MILKKCLNTFVTCHFRFCYIRVYIFFINNIFFYNLNICIKIYILSKFHASRWTRSIINNKKLCVRILVSPHCIWLLIMTTPHCIWLLWLLIRTSFASLTRNNLVVYYTCTTSFILYLQIHITRNFLCETLERIVYFYL